MVKLRYAILDPDSVDPPTKAAVALRRGGLDELVVLGDFSRLSESPLWRLSETYWSRMGADAFFGGEVPYIVTSGGHHSGDAADLFVESLLAADAAGALERELLVVELGVGSGLFAKLFLDQLEARCRRDGFDFYKRTRYVVSDGSESMLDDLQENGVFADHEDRIAQLHLPLPGVAAALEAAEELGIDLSGKVRAIHANYLLDSLPFTVLVLDGGRVWELEVRGRISAKDLQRLGCSATDDVLDLQTVGEDLDRLQAIQDSLILETRYIPIDREKIPGSEWVPKVSGDGPRQFLHSYGAMQSLVEATTLLRPGGYALITDYGYTGSNERPDVFEPQNFGRSVACAINFEQLEEHLRCIPDIEVDAPPSDPENLQTRLIGRGAADGVRSLLASRFSKEHYEYRDAPLKRAADFAAQGRFEAARRQYEEYLQLFPFNWPAYEVAAVLLAYSLEEYDAGIAVARSGLQLNHTSSGLWNILGDCHYGREEHDLADECYNNAIRMNPRDARARMNLAYVAVWRGDYAAALRLIGEALALDRDGDFSEALLEKQKEAISGLVSSAARGVLRSANRLRGHYDLPEASEPTGQTTTITGT